MKKIKTKNNIWSKKVLVLVLLLIAVFGFYFYRTTSDFHLNDNEPGVSLPLADVKFLEACSLYDVLLDAQNEYYEVVDYKCSAEQGFSGKIPNGQELTVDIFTKDFNLGVEKFRAWLSENGLEESDKLRVSYHSKPK